MFRYSIVHKTHLTEVEGALFALFMRSTHVNTHNCSAYTAHFRKLKNILKIQDKKIHEYWALTEMLFPHQCLCHCNDLNYRSAWNNLYKDVQNEHVPRLAVRCRLTGVWLVLVIKSEPFLYQCTVMIFQWTVNQRYYIVITV